MSQVEISYYQTEFGLIKLGLHAEKLCLCDWDHRATREKLDKRIKQFLEAEFVVSENSLFTSLKAQLDEFFVGKCLNLDFPTTAIGTPFQKHVWAAVDLIGYGQTLSYGELAKKVGKHKGVRSVANAVGANPLSLFTPCHRVIGSNGKLIGYAGGIPAKKFLLELESKQFSMIV